MNNIEYILDFAANLGCRMLTVGANLERVNDTMFRICHSYRLSSISIFSLSTIIIISAKSQDGQSGARQISVPHEDKHMEKLNRFNQLSRKVCAETPPPETLARLLDEAEKVSDYSLAAVISGYLIAMTSLGVLNGGTIGDIISLYAEIMALELKTPSTVFLYPAIIPLIPGGLLYNTAVNFFLHETALMLENARDCALTLVGMSIGFVLISTFTYYRRVYFFSKDIASHLLHHSHRKNS